MPFKKASQALKYGMKNGFKNGFQQDNVGGEEGSYRSKLREEHLPEPGPGS